MESFDQGLHSGPPDRVCLGCGCLFHFDLIHRPGYEEANSCPGCGGYSTAKRYFCHGCKSWLSGGDARLADKQGFLSANPRCPHCSKILVEALNDAGKDSRKRLRREKYRKRMEEKRKEENDERG